MGMARFFGMGLVLVAAMLWGTTGTVQALLPPDRAPMVVAALRMALGAATLVLLTCVARGGLTALRRLPWVVILGAGLAMAAYNLFFFNAVAGAGVGIGTALAIGSAPIWVMGFEALRGIWPTGRRLLGQGVCIAGAAILVLAGTALEATLWGMALALAAGAAYGAYSLLTARVPADVPATTTAAATFTVAAVLLAPVLWLYPLGWTMAPSAWVLLGFLGAVATGLSYILYTIGLRHVAPSVAVTLALVEPLTAWVLATVLVGEVNSPAKIGGAMLLLLGLALVVTAPRRGPALA